MILNEFLTVLYISFLAVSSPYNANYEHSANIGYQSQLKPCVVESTDDNSCFIDATFNMTAHLSYNDETSYLVDTFKFSVYLDFYYVSQNGTATKQDSLSYSISPNWSVNQSGWSSSKLATFNFTYGIDHDDDNLYIKFYDDNTLVDQKRLNTDNSYYYHSYVNYHIDTSYLADAISTRLIALHQSDAELTQAWQDGYDEGRVKGYQEGAGHQMNPEMFTIFNGILNVAMVPVNVFLRIFNWEVYGINIASMVSALLSIAVLIIIIRLVTGKSSSGD